jgi:carbamoyl-phosphate synthase large subunit
LGFIAKSCDCQTPYSINVIELIGLRKAAYQIGFPLIIKGPYYGAYKVFTDATLVERFQQIIMTWGGPVVVQQWIHGSEFDVIAVADGQGDVGGCCAIRKTLITDQGKGFGGVTIRDDTLTQIALNLIKALHWRGPLELEFIKEEATGNFYLIEINPRFPAWVDFPSAFGHNLPALLVEALVHGKMPKLPEYPTGKFFVRHGMDLLGDIEQLGRLSTDGELRLRSNDRIVI